MARNVGVWPQSATKPLFPPHIVYGQLRSPVLSGVVWRLDAPRRSDAGGDLRSRPARAAFEVYRDSTRECSRSEHAVQGRRAAMIDVAKHVLN